MADWCSYTVSIANNLATLSKCYCLLTCLILKLFKGFIWTLYLIINFIHNAKAVFTCSVPSKNKTVSVSWCNYHCAKCNHSTKFSIGRILEMGKNDFVLYFERSNKSDEEEQDWVKSKKKLSRLVWRNICRATANLVLGTSST